MYIHTHQAIKCISLDALAALAKAKAIFATPRLQYLDSWLLITLLCERLPLNQLAIASAAEISLLETKHRTIFGKCQGSWLRISMQCVLHDTGPKPSSSKQQAAILPSSHNLLNVAHKSQDFEVRVRVDRPEF